MGTFGYGSGAMPLAIVDLPRAFIPERIEVAGRSFTVIPWVRISAKSERGLPFDVELKIELQGHGFVCTELEVKQRAGGPAVALAGIRSIPVESIIRRCRAVLLPETGEPVLRFEESVAPGTTPLRFGGPLGLPVPLRRRTSKRRSADEEATDVELAAVVYRLAEVCGVPPTKAVSDQLRIPLGTARFLVARAVKRDWLPARKRAAK